MAAASSGYGEPPARSGRDLAPFIYIGGVVAVGAVILLFQNLLDARPVAAGSSLLAYVWRCRCWARSCSPAS
jgi:POT family proton-dependent oligopeptide transporter